MSETWYQRYRTEKGQVDVKNSGRELILRRGLLMIRESACVRIINNTNQWMTYDRGAVVNENLPGGGFQKIDKYKVNPGNEARLCAHFGVAEQDHALYNLEFHNSDPMPDWSGGQVKFLNDMNAFFEKLGQTGMLVLGVGAIATVGVVAVLIAKGAAKMTPAGMAAGMLTKHSPDEDDDFDENDWEDQA